MMRPGLVALCLYSVLLISCSWFKSESNYGELPFRHTVKYRGESIGILAEWYTGSVENWSRIAEINKNINPNKIELGDVILIPKGLVVRSIPLTEEFCRLKNTAPQIEPDTVEEELKKQFKSPVTTKRKKETDELIKNREDLWNELIGE